MESFGAGGFRGVVVTVILVCFFSFEMGVAVVLSFGIWKESMSGWGWMKTFSTISMLQAQRVKTRMTGRRCVERPIGSR